MGSILTRAKAQRVSRMVKLASSTSRAHILLVLASRSEVAVQDIAKAVHMTHSAVSHQLGLLLASSIVSCKKEGRIVRYSLGKAPPAKALVKLLQTIL